MFSISKGTKQHRGTKPTDIWRNAGRWNRSVSCGDSFQIHNCLVNSMLDAIPNGKTRRCYTIPNVIADLRHCNILFRYIIVTFESNGDNEI